MGVQEKRWTRNVAGAEGLNSRDCQSPPANQGGMCTGGDGPGMAYPILRRGARGAGQERCRAEARTRDTEHRREQ